MRTQRLYSPLDYILALCAVYSITLYSNYARSNPLKVTQNLEEHDPYKGQEVCIQAGNGQHFVIQKGALNRVNANSATCGAHETFRVVRSRLHSFAIYNLAHRTYLSCQPDGRLEGNRPAIGSWEEFKIHEHGDDVVSFQCLKHGERFIVAEGNGGREVNANRQAIGSWERFRIIVKDNNRAAQASPQHKPFPARWGEAPQTPSAKSHRLPYGYGYGSEELARWVSKNLKRDLRSGQYQVALRTNDNASEIIKNIGRDKFNEAFRKCPIVRYARNDEVMAIYQRTRSIPRDFDAFALFTDTWRDTPANRLNHDFVLYDDHYALLRGAQPWKFCNYNDPDVAFPRDCGKTRSVGSRWFSMPGGRHRTRGVYRGVTFEIHAPEDCPVLLKEREEEERDALNLVKNPSFDQGMTHWSEYAHGPRINGMHIHTWKPGHITGHLHGYCPNTAGGISQVLVTQSGQSYKLSFDVYSGDWDGKDTDIVRVTAGDLTQLIDVEARHSVNARDPKKAKRVELNFRATGPRTQLSFYADRGHCIDVDHVRVSPEVDSSPRPLKGTKSLRD